MREIHLSLGNFLLCVLASTLSVSADPTNAIAIKPPATIMSRALSSSKPPLTISSSDQPLDPMGLVANIVATKTCDQVVLSPDKLWLAATRTYSTPAHGHIWDDDGENTCLMIREVDDQSETGTEFLQVGSDFLYWETSSISIVKIAWSPNARFLVLMCSTFEGHQPWAFPVLVLDVNDYTLRNTGPLGTIVSQDFKFTGPSTVQLQMGEPSAPQRVDVDLAKHIAELPVVVKLKEDAP